MDGLGGEKMDTGETINNTQRKVYQSRVKAHKKRDKLEYKVILKGDHGFEKDQHIIIMDLKQFQALSLEASGGKRELQKYEMELQSLSRENKNLEAKLKQSEKELKSLGDDHQNTLKSIETLKNEFKQQTDQLNDNLKLKVIESDKLQLEIDDLKLQRQTTILYLGQILEYIRNQDHQQSGFFPWIRKKLVGEPPRVPTPPEVLLMFVDDKKGLGESSRGEKEK